MNYVFLGIFIVVSILHLYASFKRNQAFRNSTKGMIILSLLAFYATSTINYSYLIVFALVFYIAGDLLLIPKNKYCLYSGGICFLTANVLFIIEFFKRANNQISNVLLMSIIGSIYLFFIIFVIFIVKGSVKKNMIIFMFGYLLFNAILNFFAWNLFLTDYSLYHLLIGIGAFSFFVSDSILYSVRFNKKTVFKSHFLVMLTYVVGQFLIVFGLIAKL